MMILYMIRLIMRAIISLITIKNAALVVKKKIIIIDASTQQQQYFYLLYTKSEEHSNNMCQDEVDLKAIKRMKTVLYYSPSRLKF